MTYKVSKQEVSVLGSPEEQVAAGTISPRSAYEKLLARKRTWTPVAVSAGKLLEGGEDVVLRGLSLRCLEIPVGDFITDAMKGDLPDEIGCMELLKSNVQDEEKHDIALDLAAQAHGPPSR